MTYDMVMAVGVKRKHVEEELDKRAENKRKPFFTPSAPPQSAGDPSLSTTVDCDPSTVGPDGFHQAHRPFHVFPPTIEPQSQHLHGHSAFTDPGSMHSSVIETVDVDVDVDVDVALQNGPRAAGFGDTPMSVEEGTVMEVDPAPSMRRSRNARMVVHGPQCTSIPRLSCTAAPPFYSKTETWVTCQQCGAFQRVEEDDAGSSMVV